MKKIKSYTGIWNVEKVLYAINDFNLPFPVTFTQISWFVITEFIMVLCQEKVQIKYALLMLSYPAKASALSSNAA